MCSVSLKLLSKISEKKIPVLLTDYSHNPVGMLVSMQGHTRASKKLKQQISFSEEIKNKLWNQIIINKISNQIDTLEKLNKKEKLEILKRYKKEITNGDLNNREALSSRTYFSSLFSKEFKRFSEDIVNYCLNFVYQIIRSKISQELVALGYTTQLGIKHTSEYNYFNLSDDLIEPYRPIADYYIYTILLNTEEKFLTPDLKHKIINILNMEIFLNNQKMKMGTSIQFYVRNIMSSLENKNFKNLTFPRLYDK